MNTDHDQLLVWLKQLREKIDKLISLREKEIERYKNPGFNPDDTTRKEED